MGKVGSVLRRKTRARDTNYCTRRKELGVKLLLSALYFPCSTSFCTMDAGGVESGEDDVQR